MRVEFSKEFEKVARKLSGKMFEFVSHEVVPCTSRGCEAFLVSLLLLLRKKK